MTQSVSDPTVLLALASSVACFKANVKSLPEEHVNVLRAQSCVAGLREELRRNRVLRMITVSRGESYSLGSEHVRMKPWICFLCAEAQRGVRGYQVLEVSIKSGSLGQVKLV